MINNYFLNNLQTNKITILKAALQIIHHLNYYKEYTPSNLTHRVNSFNFRHK